MTGWRAWTALAIAWMSLAGTAWGCSCIGRATCGFTRPQDTMFVGKVLTVSVVDKPMERFVAKQRLFRFEVIESFSAEQRAGDEITVATGMGGGDCGYGFQIGQRYLVDGYKSDGGLSTGICSATMPEDAAASMIREFRILAKHGRAPALSGLVSSGLWTSGIIPTPQKPLAGIPVTLTAADGAVLRSATDAEGIYTFAALAPGSYTLAAGLPANLTTWLPAEKKPLLVTVPDKPEGSPACLQDIRALPAGHIPGRVVDAAGKPVSGMISAYPLQQGGEPKRGTYPGALVGEDGAFDLRFLPAGDYVLEFMNGFAYRNRWFYPNVRDEASAVAVHVTDGQGAPEVKLTVTRGCGSSRPCD